ARSANWMNASSALKTPSSASAAHSAACKAAWKRFKMSAASCCKAEGRFKSIASLQQLFKPTDGNPWTLLRREPSVAPSLPRVTIEAIYGPPDLESALMEGSRSMVRDCASYRLAKLDRRAFLQVGSLGALGLSLFDYLGLQAARGATKARAKSIILIYTMGGISHHDSFDPKPDAPAEIRGEFKTIPTKLPGIRFSDMIPGLAKTIDQYALIRSVHHNQTDHGVGAYYMLRGYTQPDPSLDRPENQLRANPCIGAHVARLLGSPNGLPPYIVVPGLSYLGLIEYYTAGWMGRAYDPFTLPPDPNLPPSGVPGLLPLADAPPARLDDRVSLSRAIDRRCRVLDASAGARGLSAHYERAFQVLRGSKTRR